jgi:hypothetical protein
MTRLAIVEKDSDSVMIPEDKENNGGRGNVNDNDGG